MTEKVSISQYNPRDTPEVLRIFADTAFMGEPVEIFFPARSFFSYCSLAYYLKYYPSWIFVARDENSSRLAGYICGSFSSRLSFLRFLLILPGIVSRFLNPYLVFNWRSWYFFYRLLMSFFRRELTLPGKNIKEQNPAHLHINIDKTYRGRGLGHRLMERFLAHLQVRKVPGVYLRTYCRRQDAPNVRFFSDCGFKEVDRRKVTLFTHVTQEEVVLVTMVKDLKGGNIVAS